MGRCRSTIVCCIVIISLLNSGKSEEKTACGNKAKSSLNAKRSIVSNGNLNIDVSALEKGVKRSISEGEDDCDQSKKSNIEIKQSAVSAIPGKNEDSTNEKKSNVKAYLVLPDHHDKDNGSPSRKDKQEKTDKKHSPLWSLSKLIDSVDLKTNAKKGSISFKGTNKSNESSTVKVHKNEKGVSKASVVSDPTKVIKATLSKAIEKVEKVIASKNANLITPEKAITRSKEPSEKAKTQSVAAPKSKEASPSPPVIKSPVKAPVKDPYAEIAMGPDRPKVPELKSDSNGDDGPVMRMSNGEMKPADLGSSSFKDSKPLAGQHDVGGLLDRLTDKLNSGGGGVALDTSPLTESNEVKYVQSPIGLDDESKQTQNFAVDKLKDQADLSEFKKMTETEGLLSGSNTGPDASVTSDASANSPNVQPGLDTAAQLLAGTGSQSSSSAAEGGLTTSQSESDLSAATEDSLEGTNPLTSESLMGTNSLSSQASLTGESAEDEGIAKSLSKASSLTTDAVMDMLKSSKTSDFSNAEVSPGPDPYAGEESQSDQSLGSLLGASKAENIGEEEATGLESTASDSAVSESPFSESSMPSDDLSARSAESEYERNHIPSDEMDTGSYQNKYNTEMFKKHIIMRPKRETYVSPFNSKEAFDTAI